ncbi:hypothetical protein [uncultured Helicobacter sp.]|uniref:hypothetical protein n=1 Tax=uncultured Helicobacter sp. TaxID=175537 RepID=UPI00261F71D4|nr:hypothetical protein [uncultured Helicobacter sp.]
MILNLFWELQSRRNFPNTLNNYLIHYDTDQRFWDLLNGKISVESHLQELIDLGYTHNNTIQWGEDREQFANSLTHFLKVFQEILDSHSLNVQELQALSKQEKMNTFLNHLLKG